ncbi:hypothetical protein C2845_PM07G18130 [Panicum miliaceum]|uniref:Uncharacterized protein n=1 Tax=Panicum miliaceum TaxID=4540 RepID=A0A3L6SKS0_PANMI|nr:hypothetical protein C2845_PM07G18130 [Panicum miliaceum]
MLYAYHISIPIYQHEARIAICKDLKQGQRLTILRKEVTSHTSLRFHHGRRRGSDR